MSNKVTPLWGYDQNGRLTVFEIRRRDAIRRWSIHRSHPPKEAKGIATTGMTVRRFTLKGAERYIKRYWAKQDRLVEVPIYRGEP